LILSKELKENIIAIPIINTSSIWIVTIPIQPSQLSTIISMMTNKNWIIAITNKAHFGQYGVGWSVVLGWAGFICWDWLEL
jgi:hypothetical protein